MEIVPYIFLANAEIARAIWPYIMPGIVHASRKMAEMDRSAYYLDSVLDGSMQLWICKRIVVDGVSVSHYDGGPPVDLVLITSVTHATPRSLEVVYCGGNLFGYYVDEARTVLTEFALRNACQNIRMICRAGWVKHIKRNARPGDRVVHSVIFAMPVKNPPAEDIYAV